MVQMTQIIARVSVEGSNMKKWKDFRIFVGFALKNFRIFGGFA